MAAAYGGLGGEQYDSETGLYYLRARYYDPTTGRFLSRDPANLEPNAYAYAASDPVNNSDPSGCETLMDMQFAISIGEMSDIAAGAAEGFAESLASQYAVGALQGNFSPQLDYNAALQSANNTAVANICPLASSIATSVSAVDNFTSNIGAIVEAVYDPYSTPAEKTIAAATAMYGAIVSLNQVINCGSAAVSYFSADSGLVAGIDGLSANEMVAPEPTPTEQDVDSLTATVGLFTTGTEEVSNDAFSDIYGPTNGISAQDSLSDTGMYPQAGPPQEGNAGYSRPSIVKYRPTIPGYENHHGVLDKWLSVNVEGYSSRASDNPTIALTKENHEPTKAVYREWLRENYGRPVGVSPDWANVGPRQMQELSEKMFDAASVSEVDRLRFYNALNQYLYTGAWDPDEINQR